MKKNNMFSKKLIRALAGIVGKLIVCYIVVDLKIFKLTPIMSTELLNNFLRVCD